MVCKKCGSNNVNVQAVSETNKKGCLTTLIMIALLCVPIIGWIALFMMIRGRKSKTKSLLVCQDCGYKQYL